MNNKQIFVTFQREGIHCWPDAVNHPEVDYLANPHRHRFFFRVDIDVEHDDREIEFIIFKHELEKWLDMLGESFNNQSCEMLADYVASYLKEAYPGRNYRIEVSEDGENGAVLINEQEKRVRVGGGISIGGKAEA